MRKLFLAIFLILSITSVMQLKAQEVTFKVSAPPSVILGNRFQIQYTVNADNSSNIRLSQEFADLFNVLMDAVSNSSSTVIDGGKVTRVISNTYTYTVIAKKEGTFTIGPATIKVGNSEYKSDSFTINVLPQDQAAQAQQQGRGGQQQGGGGNTAPSADPTSNENLFMRAIVSKQNVYENEGFLVTFKIYSINPMVEVDPKFPELKEFFQLEIESKTLDQIQENYNGRNYNTVIVRQVILFPINSGKIVIGSGKTDVKLRVPVQARTRSIFEGIFGSYDDITREVVSPPVAIEVKPLPAGKPANFSNAIGSYTMSSKINRTQLKANEAVTINLTIRGIGNIRYLTNPEVKFPNDFEVIDPKQDNNYSVTTAGVSGSRTIEYTAIPRYAGDFEIPPITFSYFDLQSGTYRTLSTESFKLEVERDENSASAPMIANFSGGRESLRFLGKDIRYLKTQKIHFQSYKDIFFGSFLYIMAYLMLSVLFVAFFIIYRKQVKENANIALVRTKKANKTAVRRLKQAEKLLKENKEEAFYEEVLRALWGYLSDKLNIPQSALTKDNVASELTKQGVNETLSDEFLAIIHTCEFARYAPSKTSGAMDKLFSETIHAIDTMENTIKK